MEEDLRFKLCIFGDGGVGKTSMTRRYLKRVFEEDIKMTIGTDLSTKDITIDNIKVTLQIWDFAGEDRYKILFPSFVKNADGGIFMFDLTRRFSLNHVDDWLTFFKDEMERTKKQIPILMVGSKLDLVQNRSVQAEEAIEIAKSRNLQGYFECSSKTGENVDLIFKTITKLILQNNKLQ